jgi:hypothetical protein
MKRRKGWRKGRSTKGDVAEARQALVVCRQDIYVLTKHIYTISQPNKKQKRMNESKAGLYASHKAVKELKRKRR